MGVVGLVRLAVSRVRKVVRTGRISRICTVIRVSRIGWVVRAGRLSVVTKCLACIVHS
jgi:hypothetical protein